MENGDAWLFFDFKIRVFFHICIFFIQWKIDNMLAVIIKNQNKDEGREGAEIEKCSSDISFAIGNHKIFVLYLDS